MEQHLHLTTPVYDRTFKLNHDDPILDDIEFYHCIVGRLLYLTMNRPNIEFTVHSLSQHVHMAKKSHLDATLRVVRYVKKRLAQGLLFSASNTLESMSIYCDSDWVACAISRKSITDYDINLREG